MYHFLKFLMYQSYLKNLKYLLPLKYHLNLMSLKCLKLLHLHMNQCSNIYLHYL